MDKQQLWTAVLILGIFASIWFLVFSLSQNGPVCSIQIRYALSDTVAHMALNRPRPSREHMEGQLRVQFVPNVCSREQFEDIFPREAGNWGW